MQRASRPADDDDGGVEWRSSRQGCRGDRIVSRHRQGDRCDARRVWVYGVRYWPICGRHFYRPGKPMCSRVCCCQAQQQRPTSWLLPTTTVDSFYKKAVHFEFSFAKKVVRIVLALHRHACEACLALVTQESLLLFGGRAHHRHGCTTP